MDKRDICEDITQPVSWLDAVEEQILNLEGCVDRCRQFYVDMGIKVPDIPDYITGKLFRAKNLVCVLDSNNSYEKDLIARYEKVENRFQNSQYYKG